MKPGQTLLTRICGERSDSVNFPTFFFLIDFYPRSERTWFGAHSAARQRVRFETAPLDEL